MDDHARAQILSSLSAGASLNLRGVPIARQLWESIAKAVRAADGTLVFGETTFEMASFSSDMQFDRICFTGPTSFAQAIFSGKASFEQARFSDLASFSGTHFMLEARFEGATFEANASFSEARFAGSSWFSGATFRRAVNFQRAKFIRTAWFQNTIWQRSAVFTRAEFEEEAWFDGVLSGALVRFDDARFRGLAWFAKGRFNGEARFDRVHFYGEARFSHAEFAESAWFDQAAFTTTTWMDGVRFRGIARFDEAAFKGSIRLERSRFDDLAWFVGCRFELADSFGPIHSSSDVVLDRAAFMAPALIEGVASRLSCVATRFAEGATLRLARAEILLDAVTLGKPSSISFAQGLAPDLTTALGPGMRGSHPKRLHRKAGTTRPSDERPRLLSIRGVDVSSLALVDIDLSNCLFAGSHHLDKLRIEGACPFLDSPGAWRLRIGRLSVPLWYRWTRRQALAEERYWRASRIADSHSRNDWLQRPGWVALDAPTAEWIEQRSGQIVRIVSPDRLAQLYRSLRKAQEDSKNEPGAADLYYGEMEMRRKAEATPLPERIVLTIYWLTAGYALRGLRALVWLTIVVVGLGALLHVTGFVHTRTRYSLPDSLLYAAESTLSLSGDPTAPHLTFWGRALRVVLRLTGPVLLGLSLLAVRNRVKR